MKNKLYIKNMVCDRCIMVVKQELEKLKFSVSSVELGEVTLDKGPETKQIIDLQTQWHSLGFELIDDKKLQFVQNVKNLIIELVHRNKHGKPISNYSSLLSEQLNKDYTLISNLFSEIEGTTIEHYVIHQKIEKVKELITYGEKNISEIADELDYSSVSHLSNQFKKIIGISPSQFKSLTENRRLPLDKV